MKDTRLSFTLPVCVALLLGGLLFSACQRSEDRAERPGTFVFARGSDAQKLDPADVDDGESVNTLAQIHEGLVRFISGTLEIEPALAESYEVSDDGLIYTFHLREDIRFHDGTPLNAETALFTFLRQMDPAHPGHLPGANFQYWNYLYQEIEAVRAAGPMTIEFVLSEPNASLLASLAIFPAYLVSPGALDTYGAEMQRHPVGTGPYRFVRWSTNEMIVLERNPDYWGDPAAFERLVFRVIPENTVRVVELRSGRVHALDGLQPAEIMSLSEDPRFRVHRDAGLNVGYLSISSEAERLQEREIREAISMAIDRDRLAEVALDGTGKPAHYPLPPGFLGLPKDLQELPYDPERASAILERYSERWTRPLRLNAMTAPRQYFPDSVRAASLIRNDLEQVGLRVEIEARDFKSHLDILRSGQYEMGLLGWIGDNGDPDNFLSVFFGSWAAVPGAATNVAFYRDDEMDALLLEGRRRTNPSERQAIYEKALELWRRDLPLLPLTHGENIVVTRSEVTGFQLQMIGDLRLYGIDWEVSAPDRHQ